MADRVITVYFNEDTGDAYYVDCPQCHFYKNGVNNIGEPCRNTLCTYSGVVVKVPVYIQPPLAPEPEPAKCPDCHHEWGQHDRLLEGAGTSMLPEYNPYHVPDAYECFAYAGMGNWCGCRNRSRLSYVPEGPDGALVPLPLENFDD